MKDKIIDELRKLYGPEITNLDKVSINVISEGLLINEWYEKEKWATYNQVLYEFKVLGDLSKIQELQYYLSDNKDPKTACLDMLKRINDKNSEMIRLYEKITTF